MTAIEALVELRGGGFDPNAPWPDPQPLPDGLPPVPTFDLDVLPDAVRPWIADVAERMQCPADYPAVGVMVATATLIGRQVAIRPKKCDEWTVVSNLWGMIVGRPGMLKTPALDDALQPLRALEVAAAERFEADQRTAASAARGGKIAKEEKRNAAKKAIETGRREAAAKLQADQDATPAPVRRRYITNDTTVEALGVLLTENPNGILVFRDELSGLLRTMDRNGHEGDRAFYLEAWNGTGRFTYDRIGRGTVDIAAACVSILGTIQPGPLAECQAAAADGGVGDDGLLQRFQLAVWPDVPGEWQNIDRAPDAEAKQRAHAAFTALDALGAKLADGLPFLRFAPDAQARFDQWRADLERRLRAGDMPPVLEAHLAKYRSLVPSLALICHLLDGGRGPLPAAHLERAVRWAEYLEAHARRLYAAAISPGNHAARALGERLRSGALRTPFTKRDVDRPRWRGLTDPGAVENAIATLVARGWLRGENVVLPNGGRPTTRFHVNPKLRKAK